MKLSRLVFLALVALGPMSFADKHDCSCDAECQKACAKGKSAKCECKECNHSKAGACKECDPKKEKK